MMVRDSERIGMLNIDQQHHVGRSLNELRTRTKFAGLFQSFQNDASPNDHQEGIVNGWLGAYLNLPYIRYYDLEYPPSQVGQSALRLSRS